MAKITPRTQIVDGAKVLSNLMYTSLSVMAVDMIDRAIRNVKNSTDSQKVNAIKDLDLRGVNDYKSMLLEAIAGLAEDATNLARKEVPKAKKLADINDLPLNLKKKLKSTVDILVTTQTDDLKKSISFGFIHNYDTTDSADILRKDLMDSANEWLDGNAIDAGAGVTSASTVSAAREEFFTDEDVSENIEAFQFVNGDPVTPICTELNGHIFAKDDPDLFRYTPPLHFNAVCEDSLIRAEHGDIKIQDIKVGDKVRTHTGALMPVTEFMSKFEDKEFYIIETDCGKTIKITGEHPVLTSRGWVRADELSMSDNIICFEDVINE